MERISVDAGKQIARRMGKYVERFPLASKALPGESADTDQKVNAVVRAAPTVGANALLEHKKK